MEFKEYAIEAIKAKQGKNVLAYVASVSRSKMSRRVKYFLLDGDDIKPLTWIMGGDMDKGLMLKGCGMDMIAHGLDCFYRDNGIDPQFAYNYKSLY